MNSKFTLRDFLVYFTTGTMTVLSFALLVTIKGLAWITVLVGKFVILSDFVGLVILLAVPIIYFIGHLMHGFGFLSLKIYKNIHNSLTDLGLRKYKIIEWIRLIFYFFMYKNKVINSVIQENKENKTWSDYESFWHDCARLQIDNKFGPAEYWYALNDLFKGLYTAFLFSTITASVLYELELGTIFFGLFLFCHLRAIQFADYFVKTVRRLKVVHIGETLYSI